MKPPLFNKGGFIIIYPTIFFYNITFSNIPSKVLADNFNC